MSSLVGTLYGDTNANEYSVHIIVLVSKMFKQVKQVPSSRKNNYIYCQEPMNAYIRTYYIKGIRITKLREPLGLLLVWSFCNYIHNQELCYISKRRALEIGKRTKIITTEV
jgi:hypothetical protein